MAAPSPPATCLAVFFLLLLCQQACSFVVQPSTTTTTTTTITRRTCTGGRTASSSSTTTTNTAPIMMSSSSSSSSAASSASSTKQEIEVVPQPDQDFLEKKGVFSWGTWGCDASTFPWTYDQNESCYLLKGQVTVTPTAGDGRQAVTFGKGDFVTFPAGMSCTWDVKEAVHKHFMFF